jgi:outer membrane protein assembly factor BamB
MAYRRAILDRIVGFRQFRIILPLLLCVISREDSPSHLVAGDAGPERFAAVAVSKGQWPQFRGPDGQGHAGDARLPLTWSESENIVWKRAVMGLGWSSPVVDGNEVWLTSTTDGRKNVRAFCFDGETGRQLVMTEPLFDVSRTGRVSAQNGHASPTPVLDGDRVFVHFGASGTACLRRDGTVVWRRVLPYYHHHGPATSPVLADGTLVIVCDGFSRPLYDNHVREGVDDHQFVVGLDPETGEIRWKTPRDGQHSYCTPLVVMVDGRTQVVCPGGNGVWAYDPQNGEELWFCKYAGYSVVPRPVAAKGLIFVCTGYDVPSLLAIREGASGDCTQTHVSWKATRNIPLISSPIAVGDHLYFVSDKGIASCLNIKTGKAAWSQRLEGHFAASPISVGDRLYCPNEEGITYVLRAGPKFEELARNPLDHKIAASPAVAGDRLYLRSERRLYCIADMSRPALTQRPRD